MADDVTIDNGALTDFNVAADEATGAKLIQLIKLCYSADGNRTHIGADANGLDVDVVRAPADPFGVNADAAVAAGAAGSMQAKLRRLSTDIDAIKTAVETLDNVVSGSEAQVDVVSSALPSGAATAANQATLIGHVDTLETLLAAIETAVEGTLTIAGSTTVSGTVGVEKAGAAARTSVASGTSNVTILAANANRLGGSIYNDDANALLLGMGGTDVTATNYTVSVPTNGYFEVPFGYTGIIEGLWSADGAGGARVTEYTA